MVGNEGRHLELGGTQFKNTDSFKYFGEGITNDEHKKYDIQKYHRKYFSTWFELWVINKKRHQNKSKENELLA